MGLPKHIKQRKRCGACEQMYLYTIKSLEKQIEVLTDMLAMKHLSEPIVFQVPKDSILINEQGACGVYTLDEK